MGKKREKKEPLVPTQDRRICGGIFLCQFTIVTSCVSIVYLTVAVYMPAYRAFSIGFQTEPVMCQTVNTTMASYCDWASCGEWCLTKTSGFCPQIHVTTRRNGTRFTLDNCTNIANSSCPLPENRANRTFPKRYNCNNDKECATLSGVFNCSKGWCTNFSEHYVCSRRGADGIIVDSDRDNLKLNGFFSCNRSRCTKYTKGPFCDRICPNISTAGNNVFILRGDEVVTGRCEGGRALDEARGAGEPGRPLDRPQVVWQAKPGKLLLLTCHRLFLSNSSISGTDCLNGTVLNETRMVRPLVNFTTFWRIVDESQEPLDPTDRFLPRQASLTIYNYSRLYINLEGCVNTLRGECAEFVRSHGSDGDNRTAQSRFPCFYHKNDSFMVVARFDLNKTWKELLIAIILPFSLFVISLVSLIIIGHSVEVGDDSRMRCVLCPNRRSTQEEEDEERQAGGRGRRGGGGRSREEVSAEMDLVMDGIIERTNAVAEATADTST